MFNPSRQGVTFHVKVIPRAKHDEIVGTENMGLKIRLKAPPVEGQANEELVRFLARVLGISRAQIEIVRGEHSRHKLVRVKGLSVEEITQILGK